MTEIIITSSVLILALILLRRLFWGKISRRLQYGLWLLVAVRLLVPAQFLTSSFSIMNLVESIGQEKEAAIMQAGAPGYEEEFGHDGEAGAYAEATRDAEKESNIEQQFDGEIGSDAKLQLDGENGSDAELQLGVEAGSDAEQRREGEAGSDAEQQREGEAGSNAELTGDTVITKNEDPERDRHSGRNAENEEDTEQDIRMIVESFVQKAEASVVLRTIWIVGMAATAGCLVISNLCFSRRLVKSRRLLGREGRLNVYLTDRLESPCLCGSFRPAVYLTPVSLKNEERKVHILLHEITHYRHLDHIWAIVRSICLIVYWFHPLVWAAAVLSIQDSELACDEGTLARLGEEHRQDYGRTLIEMMTDRSATGQLLHCATGMVNGKKEIRKRITAIAGYKHYMAGVAALAMVLALIMSACTFGTVEEDGGPQETEQTDPESDGRGNGQQSKNDLQSENDRQSENDQKGESAEKEGESNSSESDQDGDALQKVDGKYRLVEYAIDLTQDKIKERICFDIWCIEDLLEGKTVTEELIRELLWKPGNGLEIYVKVLKGTEETDEAAGKEEEILQEYSFAMAHAGNGNLAVTKYEKQNSILLYNNAMYQGTGSFWYQIWQFSPEGEIRLVKENSAEYYDMSSVHGINDEETVNQVLLVAEELDQLLRSSNTKVLINAAGEEEECFLYPETEGNDRYAFDIFRAEVGGSGLELKLKDYFYPNGLEPMTHLPENAEERILSGELLRMEVSGENTTAGRLDLDGDGEKEVLYLEGYSDFIGDGYRDRGNALCLDDHYRVRVNETYYQDYCDYVDPELMAYSPDGETILLAIYDDGPSADSQTYFFRYDGESVIPAGIIPDDIRTMEVVEQGVLKGNSGKYMIQTDCIVGYWIWNGTEMVLREDEVYEFTGYKWRTDEFPTILLMQLTVYEERSEESRAVIMKPQIVDIVRTDAKEWIYLEADDGTAGWIRIEDGKVTSVASSYYTNEADVDEVIYGLSHAG